MPLPARVPGRIIGRVWGIDQFREQIRTERAGGESVASIAQRYGVTPQRVYQVLK